MLRNHKINLTSASLACLVMALSANPAAAASPTIINLTQTPCQFVESENDTDHGYKSQKKADCEVINAQSAKKRLSMAKVLDLKPGKYIFRVKNKNVPYELGFWLRGKGLGRITLPSVSGGGLTSGVTKDYAIELKAGDYYYSCPLNTTPDYRIVVSG